MKCAESQLGSPGAKRTRKPFCTKQQELDIVDDLWELQLEDYFVSKVKCEQIIWTWIQRVMLMTKVGLGNQLIIRYRGVSPQTLGMLAMIIQGADKTMSAY